MQCVFHRAECDVVPVHVPHDGSSGASHPGWQVQFPAGVHVPWPLHTTLSPTFPGHSTEQSSPKNPKAQVVQNGGAHCSEHVQPEVAGATSADRGTGESALAVLPHAPWLGPPHKVLLTWQHVAGFTVSHCDALSTTHPRQGSEAVHTGAGSPTAPTDPAVNTQVLEAEHQEQAVAAAHVWHVENVEQSGAALGSTDTSPPRCLSLANATAAAGVVAPDGTHGRPAPEPTHSP